MTEKLLIGTACLIGAFLITSTAIDIWKVWRRYRKEDLFNKSLRPENTPKLQDLDVHCGRTASGVWHPIIVKKYCNGTTQEIYYNTAFKTRDEAGQFGEQKAREIMREAGLVYSYERIKSPESDTSLH